MTKPDINSLEAVALRNMLDLLFNQIHVERRGEEAAELLKKQAGELNMRYQQLTGTLHIYDPVGSHQYTD